MSVVMRRVPSVPSVTDPLVMAVGPACLLTWLITPPVEPRPNRMPAGPFSTSICSR